MPAAQPRESRSEYEGACREHGDSGAVIREVLERVGDKWSLLVIDTLAAGVLRLSELQKHIPGISQRMLTRTLRLLERDGLITRTVHPEVPPRVEYALTSVGRTLIVPAQELAGWAVEHQAAILSAREAYDAAHEEINKPENPGLDSRHMK
ncbi:winged helix-turn-helix transcriptional regulator [Nesterenkonia flava]|uniref:Helix-turn-helix domain-containing protein n=1 Tax=Nesterenkonia flava TaxID=469799 RepID=A0ABU1FSV8_9MICC|nr:helix-turn-helix domain-containing protein [Nesterenkonia flava]MDR5711724.1 helix-turn-helix domain-containing protein [Nesterenkonia flava]